MADPRIRNGSSQEYLHLTNNFTHCAKGSGPGKRNGYVLEGPLSIAAESYFDTVESQSYVVRLRGVILTPWNQTIAAIF